MTNTNCPSISANYLNASNEAIITEIIARNDSALLHGQHSIELDFGVGYFFVYIGNDLRVKVTPIISGSSNPVPIRLDYILERRVMETRWIPLEFHSSE